MKRQLDDLCVCDLYLVHEEPGFIEKKSMAGYNGLFANPVEEKKVEKMGRIFAYKSKIHPYKLKEVITGVSFDTLYETTSGKSGDNFVYPIGNKNKYSCFIVTRKNYLPQPVYLSDLEKYCQEHNDVEQFTRYLINTKETGLDNMATAMETYVNPIIEENKKVKQLLKK